MKKTDFDICLCPSFPFLGFFDALYTPTVMSLMYVSPSFVADKENHVLVNEVLMEKIIVIYTLWNSKHISRWRRIMNFLDIFKKNTTVVETKVI